MQLQHQHFLLSFLLVTVVTTAASSTATDENEPGLGLTLAHGFAHERAPGTTGSGSSAPLGSNSNAYLYGVFELYTKLDTVMTLIEHGFGKTNERVDSMEQKLGRLELMLGTLDRQLKKVETSTEFVADRFEKIYNIHTETYTICKEAVIKFDKGGSLQAKRTKQQHTRTNSNIDIIVENGDKRLTDSDAKEVNEDEEQNMLYVIGAVANMTTQRFYNKIERKMDEEFNAIDFQLKNEMIASVSKLSATTELLLNNSEKVVFSILDIRDRLADEQTMITEMENKLTNKFDQLKHLQDKAKDEKEIDSKVCSCSDSNLNRNPLLVEEKIRLLLEDYFGKLSSGKVNEINHGPDASEQSFVRERIGKDSKPEFKQNIYSRKDTTVSTTTEKPTTVAPTTERPTTKAPNFVTISMGQNVFSTKWDLATNLIATNTSEADLIVKPEFRPAKITNLSQQGCTSKSSVSYPKSCAELRVHGATCDSVYVIILRKFALKHVYCDMKHLYGGWTVLLRRGRFGNTKQITFDHTFPAYRSGFGDMHLGEFFLGLDDIHQLTSEEGPHVLQIDLEDTEGEYLSLQYSGFRIGGLADDFRFYVDGVRDAVEYAGGDEDGRATSAYYQQLASGLLAHNGSAFLTADRVRRQVEAKERGPPSSELAFAGDCAQAFQSGWWYGTEMLPFGVSKNDACKLVNTFHLMAPLQRYRHSKGSSSSSGSARTHPHYYNNNYPGVYSQHSLLTANAHQNGNNNAMSIYWSKWTRADGSPRVLKYVLMKIRPAKFLLRKPKS